MCKISSNGYNTGVTVISNLFLDKIMPDTGEQDLKVYLYLLRYAYVPSAEISLNQIAKTLDLTSNKVVKSLRYWKSEGILEFTLDESGEIESIRLNDINSLFDDLTYLTKAAASEPFIEEKAADRRLTDTEASEGSEPVNDARLSSIDTGTINISRSSAGTVHESIAVAGRTEHVTDTAPEEKKAVSLPVYTAEELFTMTDNDDHFANIQAKVESFMAPKTFGPDDSATLAGIINALNFSDELIIHLYDYCCNKKGKCNYKYISKVAQNWAAKNINTVEQAKYHEQFFDEFLISLKRELGLNNSFGASQIDKINEWVFSYGMDKEVILEGFRRAKETVNDNPYKYAAGIIKKWHEEKVHTLSDVEDIDRKHKENIESTYSGRTKTNAKKVSGYNQFNDFDQRTMTREEADELTRRLMTKNHSPEKLAAFKARLKGEVVWDEKNNCAVPVSK